MDLMTNIIVALKERAINNNHIKYLDGIYDLNKLLEYLNIDKKDCNVLYISNIVSRHIESKYNVETQSIMKTILNNKTCFINDSSIKDNKTYIIEDCNILDLKTFNELLSILPKEAKVVLIGDKNMLSTVDNNVFDLTLNVVAQKYLEKIELEKEKRTIKDNPSVVVIDKGESTNCEDYTITVHPSKSFPNPIFNNLIKINENLYSGVVNWSEFKKLFKLNHAYTILNEYLYSTKSSVINIPYLKRFIENPDVYFLKTVIMSNKSKLKDAFSTGVVTSNFLNIYYHIKIEEMKEKFIELGYPSFEEIKDLKLSPFDKRLIRLIESQFRCKYGSWKSPFETDFFNMESLSLDIILNQDRDYIFKYTIANPDAIMFIDSENVIRLSVLKCYNLLNLKELDKNLINNLSCIDNTLDESIDIEKLLDEYSKYDSELEVIYNIPYSIFNLVDWKKLSEQKSKYNLDKLLVSDLNLSILDIEKIINFKFNILELMADKYNLQGINLVFKGRQESLLFNAIFKAINKYSYQKDKYQNQNLNKDFEKCLVKIEKEFTNSNDILHLDEFLEVRKEFKSGIYGKSIRLLEYAFIDLLNDKGINWQEIIKENI